MDQKQYEAELKDLEVKIDRLRSLYDQYFRGFEKMPPIMLKKDVETKIRNLTKVRTKNTALRFRLQVQVQKYSTFLAYWQRMMRGVEEGKVRKGRAMDDEEATVPKGRIIRREGKRGEELLDIDIDLDLDLE
jgi:hypothetical protein